MAKLIQDNNLRDIVIMSPTEYDKLIEIKKEAGNVCDISQPIPEWLQRLKLLIADHCRIVSLERLL